MRAVCCALALWGCAREAPKQEAPVVVAAPVSTQAAPDAGVAQPVVAPLRMSVDHVAGNVRAAATLQAGQELGANTTVALAAGGKLTLTLGDYARVSVYGPALLQVLPDGEPALLMHDGLFTVDVAARGVRTMQSVFWFATPDVRFDVPDNVRAAVQTAPGMDSLISVVSGLGKIPQSGDSPGAMMAGSAGRVHPLGVVPQDPDPTLEAAVARMQRSAHRSTHAGSADELKRERIFRELEQHAQLREDREFARERDLVATHREAVDRDAGEAFHLRANLARVGVELAHLRELMRALKSQRRARKLTPP